MSYGTTYDGNVSRLISVTAGSDQVTFSGTVLTEADLEQLDTLSYGGYLLKIESVDDDATLTLKTPWPGGTPSPNSSSDWCIVRDSPLRLDAVEAAGAMVEARNFSAILNARSHQYSVVGEISSPPVSPAASVGDYYVAGAAPSGFGVAVTQGDILKLTAQGWGVFSPDELDTLVNGADESISIFSGGAWQTLVGNAGDVVGPASSTDGHFAQFDGLTGKLLKGGKAAPTGDVVGTSDTQTLTGKLIDWRAAVDVASATTADIGAAASNLVRITGTTTITGLGTAAAGVARWVRFAGALTLTHNATSLILPYGASITTEAGATALFVSEGSGNWRCYWYQPATSSAARTILGALAKAGDTILGPLELATADSEASAATVSLGSTTSNIVEITGTTTITSFGTAAAGVWRWVRFAGALTLTHNATSLILPYGANITTSAGDTMLAISEGSGNWRVYFFQHADLASLRASLDVREVLAADRTYYVRTDGSDSNTGLANTSGGAFLTIQKAIDTVASLDLSIYNVTISVADGTYTGAVVLKSLIGAGSVTILGNTSTPANVLISTTSASAISADGVRGSWALNGMKVETTTSGHGISLSNNSALTASNVHFGTVVNSHIRVDGGIFTFLTGYTIAGNAQRHWLAQRGGRIFKSGALTITITGTPAFSTAFADAQLLGLMQVNGITFSGSATGVRYSITLNAVIDTIGGGASYLPGDSAGSTATGGQYA